MQANSSVAPPSSTRAQFSASRRSSSISSNPQLSTPPSPHWKRPSFLLVVSTPREDFHNDSERRSPVQPDGWRFGCHWQDSFGTLPTTSKQASKSSNPASSESFSFNNDFSTSCQLHWSFVDVAGCFWCSFDVAPPTGPEGATS